MIRVTQVKLRTEHTQEQLSKRVAELLRVPVQNIQKLEIQRQSIDARKKPELFYSYTVDVELNNEDKVLKKAAHGKGVSGQIKKMTDVSYCFPKSGQVVQKHPTVIVGIGPAGLFCGYFLALHGYRPILLERGRDVESRLQDVERFWQTGILDPVSNVQFGEGGAGTFSDGKLNTLVKDKDGRNRAVLETFVHFGAKGSILYEAKPHIGTDVLGHVVKAMRKEIIRLGGEVHFESQVTEVLIKNGAVNGVMINGERELPCEQLVLAIGHSARDTFFMLQEKQVPMEAKSFAVGFRVEHPQEMINLSQYGVKESGKLGAAAYKVTAKTSSGRGVYSFCMCPGGYVVNASSEEGHLAVNGMSYSGRDGVNANSAIIVSVTPQDYGSDEPLSGIAFQRKLEEKAYRLAKGKIPVQRYGDFREAVKGSAKSGAEPEKIKAMQPADDNLKIADTSRITPQCKGDYEWADLSSILPEECNQAFVEGMEVFGRQIKGFDRSDTVLLGVESRTSSPVRICRGENLQSDGVRGLYPCGEGAGYAGGITSAAMDGIRVAEKIAEEFQCMDKTMEKEK
ncbi:MAG: FAD-dependent oxidoreductase [Acetatifactor sp.]|nr:FAD-dependent oxidoreductase [Acetatifactor sp.]